VVQAQLHEDHWLFWRSIFYRKKYPEKGESIDNDANLIGVVSPDINMISLLLIHGKNTGLLPSISLHIQGFH
jgi:hypothetical protein